MPVSLWAAMGKDDLFVQDIMVEMDRMAAIEVGR